MPRSRFGHSLLTALALAALLVPVIPSPSANGQSAARGLSSPAWNEFRVVARQYDSLQAVFARLEAEDPELKNPVKLQMRLQEDMPAIRAIFEAIPQKALPAIKELPPLDGLGIDDLRVVKLAAASTSQIQAALDANTRMLPMLKDADSVREIRREQATFHASLGGYDAAAAMVAEGVFEGETDMEKAQIYELLSGGYAEQAQIDKARTYGLYAILALGGARTEALQQSAAAAGAQAGGAAPNASNIDQYFMQRYAAVLAPLLLHYAAAKDTSGEAELTREAEVAVGDKALWTGALVAAQREVGRMMKEREHLDKPAAEWAEHQWLGSTPLSVETLKGKVVLIDFFATWCRPCINAFPHLREWDEKYKAKGLVIVGLTNYQGRYDGAGVQPEVELAKLRDDFIPKHKLTWAVGVEKSGRKTFNDYGVNGIPHVVLVDRAGKVRYAKTGAAGYDETERMIVKLLGEK